MHNHHGVIDSIGDQWRGRCTCKQRGPLAAERWAADDWIKAHLHEVARIQAHQDRTPSLATSIRQYREAEVTARNDADRALWKQLADELETRLNQVNSEELQLPLWT